MNTRSWLSFLVVSAATTLWHGSPVTAAIYEVNRSWTDGVNSASLVGTVELPLGNYSIMNQGISPFTEVDLTLSVNGVPFLASLNFTDTSVIGGTGEFLIEATLSHLIFDVANADGVNPADLIFRNSSSIFPRYMVGADGNPGFEMSDDSVDSVLSPVDFSTGVEFGRYSGTSVSDSGSLLAVAALALSAMGWISLRQRASV